MRSVVITCIVLVAVLLTACAAPAVEPLRDSVSLVGSWYLVDGDDAQALQFLGDSTGVTYVATVDALQGKAPGLGPPRPFSYSVADGRVSLDFSDEPDATLDVSGVSSDVLIIRSASDDEWIGTWSSSFD